MLIFIKKYFQSLRTYAPRTRTALSRHRPKWRLLPPTLLGAGVATLLWRGRGADSTPLPLSPAKAGVTSEHELLLEEMAASAPTPASETLPVRNLVFKGGGPKGLAYVTALDRLEQELGSLEGIMRVAGSSAGSIVAALMAVGYRPDEIKALLKEQDAQGRPVMLWFALDSDDDQADRTVIQALNAISNSWWPKARALYEVSTSWHIITHKYFLKNTE